MRTLKIVRPGYGRHCQLTNECTGEADLGRNFGSQTEDTKIVENAIIDFNRMFVIRAEVVDKRCACAQRVLYSCIARSEPKYEKPNSHL